MADNDAAQRALAYDPFRLVDGIEASDDPLLEARSSAYALPASPEMTPERSVHKHSDQQPTSKRSRCSWTLQPPATSRRLRGPVPEAPWEWLRAMTSTAFEDVIPTVPMSPQQFPLNLSCERKTICNMLFGNWLWQQTRSSYCTLSMLLVL